MDLYEILDEIIKGGYEDAVFKALSSQILQNQQNLKNENQHYKASIRAIKKINRGKNKDIDSLCEVEE